MNYFKSKTEQWIDSIGVIALIILFIFWRVSDKAVNIAGTLAASFSLILFIIVCLNFVRKWMVLCYDGDTDIYSGNSNGKITAIIFFSFMLLDLFVLGIIHYIRVLFFHDTTTFMEGLNLFLHIDTGYYLKIAEQWYLTTDEYIYDLVFYPGYPIVIKLVNCIFNNYLLSATVVSGLFYSLSACMIYKVLCLDYDQQSALRGVKFFAIIPASFFFVAPMSESMFFFLCTLAIYLSRKDNWFLGCCVAALSSFTRSLGIIMIVPFAFTAITGMIREAENRKKWLGKLLIAFIIPAGTLAYLFINYKLTGNAFAFSSLEFDKWGQSLGLFFDTTAFQIDNALADIQQPYYTNALGLWLPNVAYCFGVLILMVFASKYIRAEYSIWFICYYVIAIGATYLISAPRYLVACVPVYPAIVQITKNKKMDIFLTILFIVISLYYIFAFAARWEVF